MVKHARKRTEELDPKDQDMDMTSMIDVTFLLLIFFMCTLKFKTLDGRLSAYLPDEGGVNPHPATLMEPLDVSVLVRNEGTRTAVDGQEWNASSGKRWVFGDDRVLEYRVGPRRGLNLSELRQHLSDMSPEAYSEGVLLAPGDGVVQGEAVALLDLFIDLGIEKVRIQGAR